MFISDGDSHAMKRARVLVDGQEDSEFEDGPTIEKDETTFGDLYGDATFIGEAIGLTMEVAAPPYSAWAGKISHCILCCALLDVLCAGAIDAQFAAVFLFQKSLASFFLCENGMDLL
ncbi:hypothetical protein PIB30_060806, partial [Stylosanthes scabra]|nr:hypothetical protein [Stylosanthes scabra]